MTGQDFERSIVHAFNHYADVCGRELVSYRHYQMRYQPQLFDVLVDSCHRQFYLAIECKSIDAVSCGQLYFKKHFGTQKGIHQVQRETEWLLRSGRSGYLCVELRRPGRARTACYFVHWHDLLDDFESGKPGVTAEEILSCPSCDKVGGKYIFDDEFLSFLFYEERAL